MEPTSDERRAVANSLRARAAGVGFAYHDVYALNDGWVYRTLHEIVEAIGCAEIPHPAEWMARLADLIDPTCTVVWKHTGSYPYEACSVCGGAFEHAPSYYTYCPECGARLVTDDGRD